MLHFMFLQSFDLGANSNWKQTTILNSNKIAFTDYCVSSSVCALRVAILALFGTDIYVSPKLKFGS